jgi:hypothetical protein
MGKVTVALRKVKSTASALFQEDVVALLELDRGFRRVHVAAGSLDLTRQQRVASLIPSDAAITALGDTERRSAVRTASRVALIGLCPCWRR